MEVIIYSEVDRDETCATVTLVTGVLALYVTVAAKVSRNTLPAETTELPCKVTVCTGKYNRELSKSELSCFSRLLLVLQMRYCSCFVSVCFIMRLMTIAIRVASEKIS